MPFLGAALMVLACGQEGALAARRPASVELVTRGGHAAYSASLDKIAFARFDPPVIGADDLSGRNDGSGTFQL
jgi:hypothetical protein